MKEIVIETEYGRISINKETKEAYFHTWDYCSPIEEDGTFKGWHGETFRVLWGIGKWTDVIIERSNWKEIGRAAG